MLMYLCDDPLRQMYVLPHRGRGCYPIQSRYNLTGTTSPSADPITPGATGMQNFKSLIGLELEKKTARRKRESKQGLPLSRQHPYHKAKEVLTGGGNRLAVHLTDECVLRKAWSFVAC